MKEKVKKKHSKKALKIVLFSLLFLLLIFTVTLFIILEPEVKIKGYAEFNEAKIDRSVSTVQILDDENQEINSGFYDSGRVFTPIDSVQQHTIDAFISIEDKRFYSHSGIDIKRIMSAAVKNTFRRKYSEGGSTITQQLVKNTHLNSEKTLNRKIQEIRIARDIERKKNKDEILEAYLNILYFGNSIYGIGNASKLMFSKEPHELTIDESALLAGIINSPANYNPYKKPEQALKRRNLVLSMMLKNKKITEQQYSEAVNKEIVLEKDCFKELQFIHGVIDEAAKILGCNESELFNKNIKIGTTLNSDKQQNINKILLEAFKNFDGFAGSLVIDNTTSEILAFSSNTDTNIAKLKRQPGSTIKPILSYAPALEKHIIVPATPLYDAVTNFGGYTPSNYNDKYYGYISAKQGLSLSSNICAIKLLDMNGIEFSKSLAKNAGIPFSKNDKSLAIALGGFSEGVTLKQLAGSYLPFSNNGNFSEPVFIRYIMDQNDKVIYERKMHSKKIMSEETAYFINEMLGECAKTGTAKRLKHFSNVCAKTGTVGDKDGNTDSYCVAYNPDYTVIVWAGTKNSGLRHKYNGGGLPSAVTGEILASPAYSNKRFQKPSSIIDAAIDLKEYHSNHRLVAADPDTPLHEKRIEHFTRLTLPKNYYETTNPYSAIFKKPELPELPSKQNEIEYRFLDDEMINYSNFMIV